MNQNKLLILLEYLIGNMMSPTSVGPGGAHPGAPCSLNGAKDALRLIPGFRLFRPGCKRVWGVVGQFGSLPHGWHSLWFVQLFPGAGR